MTLKDTIAGLETLKSLFEKKADQHRAEADVERLSRQSGKGSDQRAKFCDERASLLDHAIRHMTAKSKRLGFIPPSVSEVKAQMKLIGLPESEAGTFVDHYESNGWKVGGVLMSNWEAAARNWSRRFFEKNPRSKAEQTDKDPDGWTAFLLSEGVPFKPFKYAPEFLRSKFGGRK